MSKAYKLPTSINNRTFYNLCKQRNIKRFSKSQKHLAMKKAYLKVVKTIIMRQNPCQLGLVDITSIHLNAVSFTLTAKLVNFEEINCDCHDFLA